MKKKEKIITVRMSQAEFDIYKNGKKKMQKRLGLKINTSALIRHTLKNANNFEYLLNIGFISYQDYMDATLFHKKKFISDF